MNNKRLISLTVCLILATVPGISSLILADIASETDTKAEQHLEKANELRKAADYDAAITEYKKVMSLSPKSKNAQDAQYWIGQSYFEAKQFDAALTTFQELINEFPDSMVVSTTKTMIERVQQAKKNKSLFEAVEKADIEQIKWLISQGANVNASMSDQSWTPLLAAASVGHAQGIKVLLENGAKVDVGDVYGYTPLQYALWSKDEESVKTLISAGADINKHPNNDYPPLFHVVWEGYQAGTRILIDAGADVNAEDGDGWTPLYWAIKFVHPDVARQFIGTGVKIPALHNAILEGNLARVKQFIESGTDVDTRDKVGCTPAYWALSVGQKEIAEYLLDQGADIKVKQGRTLLHQASKAGFVEIVKSLIAKGADVDARSDRGDTPLKIAALAGHKEIVKLLIAHGAAVNITAKNGRHPLGDAAREGHEEVVRLLLASGANVNLQPEDKLMCGTALHAAAREGHVAIVDLLIANGADVNAVYKHGTPLLLAVAHVPDVEHKRIEEIFEKLLAHGADVNAKSPSRGDTPLHQAAKSGHYLRHQAGERGHYTLARRLIAAGADVNATNKKGHTPIWYAKDEDCTEIVELLRKHGAKE